MSAENRLSSQEFLGVISTRLAHRLSNYQSALVGSLGIHDSPNATNEQRAEALAAVREAARRSGQLLDRFSELSRGVRVNESQCLFAEFLKNISAWISARPDWRLEIAQALRTANNERALAGPWKWFAFSLDAIAENASPGEIKIDRAMAPPGPPLLEQRAIAYVSVVITINGTELIDWHEHREQLKSWPLAASYELLQYFGARPKSDTAHDGRQRTQIILPLIDAES